MVQCGPVSWYSGTERERRAEGHLLPHDRPTQRREQWQCGVSPYLTARTTNKQQINALSRTPCYFPVGLLASEMILSREQRRESSNCHCNKLKTGFTFFLKLFPSILRMHYIIISRWKCSRFQNFYCEIKTKHFWCFVNMCNINSPLTLETSDIYRD